MTGKKYQFDTIYEPSGVEQLNDGRVIVVEDERINPLSIVSFDQYGRASSTYLTDENSSNKLIGRIEDLEGVATDNKNKVYAISSQTPDTRGRREDEREVIVQFEVKGHQACQSTKRAGLLKAILKKYPQIKKRHKKEAVNIESLEYDNDNKRLLLGLRSPLIKNHAVLLTLDNPSESVIGNDDFELGENPILLDLAKGGFRSMVFVKQLNGYLIASRRERKSFKLWFCEKDFQNQPHQVKLSHFMDIGHVEGICPVSINGESLLLLVFDDGDRKSKVGAHYAFLSYEQLSLETFSVD